MRPAYFFSAWTVIPKATLPVLLLGALTVGPSPTTPACCPPAVVLHCPVNGISKDYPAAKCPSGYCPRKVTLKSSSMDYKGGKIYFCCIGCIDEFKKEPGKFAAHANHQLVSSYQATQVGCPLCGGELKKEVVATVANVAFWVCNEDCKNKLTQAKPAEQLQMVFGDAAFSKAFKVLAQANPQPKSSAAPVSESTCDAPAASCCCQTPAAQTARVKRD